MGTIDSKNYVDKAESVIKELVGEEQSGRRNELLTTSQLRKQLAMTAELFAMAEKETSDKLNDELLERIEYLRVQLVYQAGREPAVKRFLEKAGILEVLKDVKGSKEKFLSYCRYMEALVAFRKYHGLRDD